MDAKEKRETKRAHAAAAACEAADIATRWAAVKACLASWTVDGDPAARPTITLFYAGAHSVKAVLNDRRAGMQLWATGVNIVACLDALEDALAGPEVPWESTNGQGGHAKLLQLFGLLTGRKGRPQIE